VDKLQTITAAPGVSRTLNTAWQTSQDTDSDPPSLYLQDLD